MCAIKILIACLVVSASAANNGVRNKDLIGFPEVEENVNVQNKENRTPVYLPATCPLNELYYPGDQKDDWICDCRPAFVYHPPTDQCWPAFQRGPCPQNEYLVLPSNSAVPVCVKNPCVIDGYVTYNNNCERIGSTKPCEHMLPNVAAVGVNATTLVVSCVRLNFESRLLDLPKIPDLICPPGCRRSVSGKCVPISF
ncbi:uncharacterized protein LOC126374983 [Pectinophora gossypiella]|uniref:uncharacterized protein LOC126374983 n=1 Tax=Pectinophora gossypiella TaxID=13191 RepID=UPI00214E5EE7|nr:uncharacterized protein LOC126374983 [Pectinophora gossypiella]